MSIVLVIVALFTTFSQTVQAFPVKMNTISNGIEMVEKNFTETSIIDILKQEIPMKMRC